MPLALAEVLSRRCGYEPRRVAAHDYQLAVETEGAVTSTWNLHIWQSQRLHPYHRTRHVTAVLTLHGHRQ